MKNRLLLLFTILLSSLVASGSVACNEKSYDLNGQYLVQHLPNLTHQPDFEALLNSSDASVLTAAAQSQRAAYPHEQAQCYLYLPQIGILSQTDAAGLGSSYNYDGLGRLLTANDADGQTRLRYGYQYASDNTQTNRITSYAYRQAGGISNPTYQQAAIAIQHLDGLGRPLQTVSQQASPDANSDIVSGATNYDGYGRTAKTYLPFANSGSGNRAALPASIDNDSHPYSEPTLYDNSPLNRLYQTQGIGQAWANANKNTKSYTEVVGGLRQYSLSNNEATGATVGSYPANSLYQQTTTDEQGHRTITVTDFDGKVIEKRREDDNSQWLTTAYVYDGSGRLRYVLPPKAYSNPAGFDESSVFFKENIFGYHYDNRDRLTEKNVPGGGWTKFVYDRAGRKVLEQSENQRLTNSWSFVKYDALGREISRGQVVNGGSRQALQDGFDGMAVGYEVSASSNQSFPFAISEADLQAINYFDSYSWLPANMAFDAANAFHSQQSNVIGLPTGAKVRNLIDNAWLYSVNYYDNKKRVIQSFSQNQFAQIERTDVQYNFAGEILKSKQYTPPSGVGGLAVTVLTETDFDHVGRATKTSHGINAPATEIARMAYDNVGRLVQKKILPDGNFTVGGLPVSIIRPPNPVANTQDIATQFICLQPGTTIIGSNTNSYLAQIGTGNAGTPISGLQTIDYQYHIRGGLRGINLDNGGNPTPNTSQGDLFSYKLDYETAGYFDGNIGKQTWNSPLTPEGGTNAIRSYVYNYDAASRLKSAIYTGINGENYSLPNIDYDQNGNILNLQRKGKNNNIFGDIDNLTYSYNAGNKLLSVSDAVVGNEDVGDFKDNNIGTDYDYWPDGSLKKDLNKGISQIDYDSYLKKVSQVSFSNGNWVKFFYDGLGTLLKRSNSLGDVWQYVGTAVYKNGGDGQPYLYQLSQPEGRIVLVAGNGSTPRLIYEFEYRDIWGNLRVAFKANNGTQLEITQKNDYDITGFELKPLSTENAATRNNRKFQNQERIADFDLDIDFFKFRPSDSKIARFWQIDPLADKYQYNSPYALQENKFGAGIELEGKEIIFFAELPPVFLGEVTTPRPIVEPTVGEVMTRSGLEASGRTSGGRWSPTPEQRANFARGNKIEAEQLKKMGLEKNTKPFEAIDPKTGKVGKTIPDAMKDGQTVDVKNVSKQGLSKQLRLQRSVSNSNGKEPILRINEGAELSKPLENGGFDIQKYSLSPPIIQKDNTNIEPIKKVPL